MKRFSMLTTAFLLAAASVNADDYALPYLVFKQATGAQTTVAVKDLEITFSDGQLVAKNSDGTQAISLASLASMQFAATADDLINAIQATSLQQGQQVYDLSGRRAMPRPDGSLPRGLYVVRKSDGSTQKISVK